MKENKSKNKKSVNKKKKCLNNSPGNSEDEEVQYFVTENKDSADDECIYCQEPYRNDKRGEAWIKCIKCS